MTRSDSPGSGAPIPTFRSPGEQCPSRPYRIGLRGDGNTVAEEGGAVTDTRSYVTPHQPGDLVPSTWGGQAHVS